jgi:hypothetical protein
MRTTTMFLMLAIVAAGCGRSPAPPAVADVKPVVKANVPATVPEKKPAPAGGGGLIANVKRKVETAELRNALKQIGLAYTMFYEERRRAPNDLKELAPFYENNSKLSGYITEGDIAVAFKIKGSGQGLANVPLAYEPNPDLSGQRLVATYGGAVELMPEAEFQEMKSRK